MPVSLSDILVIGISSRALFDLEDENKIYEEKGLPEYRKYQRENEKTILKPGTAFYLVEALLNLNKFSEDRLVEVIVMSSNTPETGVRMLNTIAHYGLDITRSAFTGGGRLDGYIEAFEVDLFLSKDETDVQAIIDSGTCAAALIYDPPADFVQDYSTVRIAFDADAVLFSEESELVYKTKGLDAFHKNETDNQHIPLQEGPFARFLKTLSKVQNKILENNAECPLRIGIVTARSSPAHMRVINTLREWGVQVNEAFFLGGVSKDKVLKAFKAHIFFDDQDVHLKPASTMVPVSRVLYKSDSEIGKLNH
jgi:5'-nucleotidase